MKKYIILANGEKIYEFEEESMRSAVDFVKNVLEEGGEIVWERFITTNDAFLMLRLPFKQEFVYHILELDKATE